MGIKGDTAALKAYAARLRHLAANSKYIAKGAAPKIEALAKQALSQGVDPYGTPHVPAKDGGQALSGTGIGEALTVRVLRSGKRIAVVASYPLHFHHGGTRTKGRKFQRQLRRTLRKEGYNRAGIKGAIADLNEQRKAGSAGAVWDPERPIVPNEADGIPDPWREATIESAKALLETVGAREKG